MCRYLPVALAGCDRSGNRCRVVGGELEVMGSAGAPAEPAGELGARRGLDEAHGTGSGPRQIEDALPAVVALGVDVAAEQVEVETARRVEGRHDHRQAQDGCRAMRCGVVGRRLSRVDARLDVLHHGARSGVDEHLGGVGVA